MITPFDGLIFIAILLALLLSDQPKRAAVALCTIALVLMIALDSLIKGWAFYYLAVFIEVSAALILMNVANTKLRIRENRMYFRALAAFFLISGGIALAFITDLIVAHRDYVFYSHAIAVAHVAFMVVYSDGTRNALGTLADWFTHRDGHLPH